MILFCSGSVLHWALGWRFTVRDLHPLFLNQKSKIQNPQMDEPFRSNYPLIRKCCFASNMTSITCSLKMKYPVLIIIMLVAIASGEAGEKHKPAIVQLPRPNSGTFSFAQAEA